MNEHVEQQQASTWTCVTTRRTSVFTMLRSQGESTMVSTRDFRTVPFSATPSARLAPSIRAALRPCASTCVYRGFTFCFSALCSQPFRLLLRCVRSQVGSKRGKLFVCGAKEGRTRRSAHDAATGGLGAQSLIWHRAGCRRCTDGKAAQWQHICAKLRALWGVVAAHRAQTIRGAGLVHFYACQRTVCRAFDVRVRFWGWVVRARGATRLPQRPHAVPPRADQHGHLPHPQPQPSATDTNANIFSGGW